MLSLKSYTLQSQPDRNTSKSFNQFSHQSWITQLKKCRLFLILVKEKEANLVIKQNVNILKLKFIEKFPNNNKVAAI